MSNKVNLLSSSILHIPLQCYAKDFTFIVNNAKYETSRIIADLISPKIAHYHLIDPTLSEYSINTKEKGDFQLVLNLADFKTNEIPFSEFPFISEIFDNLETSTTTLKIQTLSMDDVNTSNVINLLKNQQNHRHFYYDKISEEIEYIASKFNEMKDDLRRSCNSISPDLIEEIISNPMLKLDSEDQLVDFINEIYYKNPTFSILYSHVIFTNVSSEMMKEFLELIDLADISREMWDSLSDRLSQQIIISDEIEKLNEKGQLQVKKLKERRKPPKEISYEKDHEFEGVFNYLKKESNIDSEVNISFSSKGGGEPQNLLSFDDPTANFFTENIENSWICFEFRKRSLIPKNYTIRSYNWNSNVSHPKSWTIEGSNNNANERSWVVLDVKEDCPFLNGKSLVHTFRLQNDLNQSFKFLRIRQTAPNWANYNFLKFDSIEFYGTLI